MGTQNVAHAEADLAAKLRMTPAPKALSKEEARIWEGLVELAPPGHFNAADFPAMAQYCRLTAQQERLAAELEDEPLTITTGKDNVVRVNPKLTAVEKITSMARKLALRLGIKTLRDRRLRAELSVRQKLEAGEDTTMSALEEGRSLRTGLIGTRVSDAA